MTETITVHDGYGGDPVEVEAEIYGPLAINNALKFIDGQIKESSEWNVTHISTAGVVARCDTKATARKIAKLMQDWPEWERVKSFRSKKALRELTPKRAAVLEGFHCDHDGVYSMNGRKK